MEFVKVADAWRCVPKEFVKISGSWKTVLGRYTKIGGSWKQGHEQGNFPDNYIHIFKNPSDMPPSCYCQPLTTYYGYFPLMTTTGALVGTTTGQNSHNGSDHGTASSITVSTYSHPQCQDRDTLPNGDPAGTSSHVHGTTTAFAAHTHTDGSDVSNSPEYANLIPAKCSFAVANEVFLFYGVSVPSGFTNYTTYLNRYIRFNSAISTGGTATHTHISQSPYLDQFNAGVIANESYLRDLFWYRYHDHYLAHTHVGDNLPSYYDLWSLTANADIYVFSSLPSGIIGLFSSTTLPAGWTAHSASASRLARIGATAGLTGGSSAHTHTLVGATTSASTNQTTQYEIEAGTGRYRVPSHTHTVTHSHATAVTSIPLSKYVYVAKKD